MAKKRLISSLEPGRGALNSYYLPKGLLRLRVAREGNAFTPACARQIIVDSEKRFFLLFNGNAFFREALDLTFTKEGFLKRIRAKSTRGPEAEEPTEWDSSDPGMDEAAMNGPDAPAGPLVYDYAFDPFDEKVMEQVNAELAQVGADFKVSVQVKGSAGPENGIPAADADGRRSGIFYRPVELMEVRFEGQGRIRRELITLPHPEKVYFLEIPESALAKPAFSLHFGFAEDSAYQGVPRQISLDRPGEILTLTQSPVQVLREVAQIPGEIFQMKINTATNRTALLRQESDLQQALFEREKAQEEYEYELDRYRHEARREQEILREDLESEQQDTADQLEVLNEALEEMAQEIRALKKVQAAQTNVPGALSRQLMQYDVRLQVLRYSSGRESTLGLLFDVTNGRKFLAYTLEDEHRAEKVHGKTRIPAGVYPIRFRREGGFHSKYSGYKWSKDIHKGMLHVQEVPGFEYILIHTGNDDKDTEGCLLVGDSADQNLSKDGKIAASQAAYKRIYPPLAEALEAGKTVGIQYSDFDGVG